MISHVITKSIKENAIEYLLRLPDIVLNDLEKGAKDWLLEYFKKHKTMPTEKRFKESDHFSFWDQTFIDDPITDVWERCSQYIKNRYASAEMNRITAEYTVTGIYDTGKLTDMTSTVLRFDVSSTVSTDNIDDSIFVPKIGIDLGMTLDKKLTGIAKGELCVLAARPETGKTTISIFLAVKWALEGKKVYLASKEMMKEQLWGRVYGVISGFNPTILRRDTPVIELEAMQRKTNRNKNKLKGSIVIPEESFDDIDAIRPDILTHRPDVMIIDGLYLIEDTNSKLNQWQEMGRILKGAREMGSEFGMSVFGTTQMNRQDNIAYSDEFWKVPDSVLFMVNSSDAGTTKEVSIKKNRNGSSLAMSYIEFDWTNMEMSEKMQADGSKNVIVGRKDFGGEL